MTSGKRVVPVRLSGRTPDVHGPRERARGWHRARHDCTPSQTSCTGLFWAGQDNKDGKKKPTYPAIAKTSKVESYLPVSTFSLCPRLMGRSLRRRDRPLLPGGLPRGRRIRQIRQIRPLQRRGLVRYQPLRRASARTRCAAAPRHPGSGLIPLRSNILFWMRIAWSTGHSVIWPKARA